MTLTPASRRWLPIDEVEVGFTCKTNPALKLSFAGDNTAIYENGKLHWLGDTEAGNTANILNMENDTKVYLTKEEKVVKTNQVK